VNRLVLAMVSIESSRSRVDVSAVQSADEAIV